MYKLFFEKGTLSGYGIQCGEIIIKDITFDKQKLQKLVYYMNHYRLDPIHLYDVIEDFLADNN